MLLLQKKKAVEYGFNRDPADALLIRKETNKPAICSGTNRMYYWLLCRLVDSNHQQPYRVGDGLGDAVVG